ncbi:uncharacterized protein EI90DRAFT_3294719 [Cantharellus anzutake]|uniref:uncharacterized protein n=1 Tax=Cantharellus anzutake TaxID=1750568 RepID=UPI001905B199|nr:uncharacterized protein EI90DRAFT_3294719 [Cantharellus anzutake]KAF8312573.1 hypothetical protein EI90DRAFT_3294719 [Cantharellus anzutake]
MLVATSSTLEVRQVAQKQRHMPSDEPMIVGVKYCAGLNISATIPGPVGPDDAVLLSHCKRPAACLAESSKTEEDEQVVWPPRGASELPICNTILRICWKKTHTHTKVPGLTEKVPRSDQVAEGCVLPPPDEHKAIIKRRLEEVQELYRITEGADYPMLRPEDVLQGSKACPRLEHVSLYIDATDVWGSRFSFDNPPVPSNRSPYASCLPITLNPISGAKRLMHSHRSDQWRRLPGFDYQPASFRKPEGLDGFLGSTTMKRTAKAIAIESNLSTKGSRSQAVKHGSRGFQAYLFQDSCSGRMVP